MARFCRAAAGGADKSQTLVLLIAVDITEVMTASVKVHSKLSKVGHSFVFKRH
jgi:hypothetical protein